MLMNVGSMWGQTQINNIMFLSRQAKCHVDKVILFMHYPSNVYNCLNCPKVLPMFTIALIALRANAVDK